MNKMKANMLFNFDTAPFNYHPSMLGEPFKTVAAPNGMRFYAKCTEVPLSDSTKSTKMQYSAYNLSEYPKETQEIMKSHFQAIFDAEYIDHTLASLPEKMEKGKYLNKLEILDTTPDSPQNKVFAANFYIFNDLIFSFNDINIEAIIKNLDFVFKQLAYPTDKNLAAAFKAFNQSATIGDVEKTRDYFQFIFKNFKSSSPASNDIEQEDHDAQPAKL